MSKVEMKVTWHGVPREQIEWHPSVDEDLCIGCGICVLGCGPKVFDFDYTKNKAVVVQPLKCKVGCVTCANTCPVVAISFPPLSFLHKLIKNEKIIAHARKEIKDQQKSQ